MDIEKMKKKMEEWSKSPAAEIYFEDLRLKDEIRQARYKRFEKWLETNDFDKLMYRLILEHGDEYVDKCYHNGYMPMPNNKLSFIIDYIVDNYASIKVNELNCDFANSIHQFKGYYFQHIHGQGTITRIYNKDDLRMLLQV